MEQVIQPLRCPRCNSSQVHIRLQRNEIVCHACGNISSLEKEEKKVEEQDG